MGSQSCIRIPVAEWPAALQRNACSLSPDQRRAVNRVLRFAREHVRSKETDAFAPEVLSGYAAFRAAEVKVSKVRDDFIHLLGATIKLLPDRDWLWLKRETSRLRRAAKTPKPLHEHKRRGGSVCKYGIPFGEWPARHRLAFEAAFSKGTPGRFSEFSENPGYLCHKSKSYQERLKRGYSLYLGYVRRAGLPDVISPESLQGWIDSLRARKCTPHTVGAYVERLERTIQIVEPGKVPEWLTLSRNHLLTLAKYAPKKKDGRHVDPVLLWLIGYRLIQEARTRRREYEETALMFRNGLIVMFLASTPVRLENIASIELGRHLSLPEGSPGKLAFSAREMKGKRPASYSLWPEIRSLIDEYLATYRPVLARDYGGKALWLADRGRGPLEPRGLHDAVEEVTEMFKEILGGPINPHLFRDAVATALIERFPENPEYAMLMLQHRHPEVTRDYQEAADSIHAALRLNETLTVTRKKLGIGD